MCCLDLRVEEHEKSALHPWRWRQDILRNIHKLLPDCSISYPRRPFFVVNTMRTSNFFIVIICDIDNNVTWSLFSAYRFEKVFESKKPAI
jgi:hypothetical protein